jgi:hypothetical protein
VRQRQLRLHVRVVRVERLGAREVVLALREVAAVEQHAAQDEVGQGVGRVELHGAQRVGVGAPLTLVPAVPGHAGPLVEVGERQSGLGPGEAGVPGEGAGEQRLRLALALGRAAAQQVEAAQPALPGPQVRGGPRARLLRHVLLEPLRQRARDGGDHLVGRGLQPL